MMHRAPRVDEKDWNRNDREVFPSVTDSRIALAVDMFHDPIEEAANYLAEMATPTPRVENFETLDQIIDAIKSNMHDDESRKL